MSIPYLTFNQAGGNLGPPLLRALSTSFNLSVLSRASSKATFDSSVKVHKIADEYPLSELVSILKGQDAVITLLRAGATELIKRCIDASVQAGVKRFIPGEFGSNSGSAAAREAVPIFEKKWEVKNYLVEKEREGLSWTSVVCGSFFDWYVLFLCRFFECTVLAVALEQCDETTNAGSDSN